MSQVRTAVVTGAASKRGIGRATAARLGQAGWSIAILDIDGPLAEQAARDIADQFGVLTLGLGVDVTDETSIDAGVTRVETDLPPIEALVNIAGVTGSFAFLDIAPPEWDRIFSVNVRGTYLVTRRVLPILLNAGRGRIVNMSSVSAERGGGVFGGVHYSAAKAAIQGFTRALARELAATGITVNAVAPGLIDTDITAGKLTVEREQAVLATIPMHRKGNANEVASTIAYLVSDDASYVTGSTYDINGGLHIH
jgi:2-hydroxycyclohexanecarboxyl-CoA dehydrogenase